MKPVVFLGPTLDRAVAAGLLDADVRPPVAQGDVYRAAQSNPPMIGIVDGFFDGVPSVWHKEILWAMDRGIAVFGAASMGALRAAELAPFGMIGIGSIFADYLARRIEDDDEVAVVHAPAELGFKPLSEPMVSVRATVANAVAQGVVADDEAAALLAAAKAIHYRDRTWPGIIDACRTGAIEAAVLDRCAAWLPAGRIDAKRDDAIAMLKAMAGHDDMAERPRPDGYAFEWTGVWNDLVQRAEAAGDARPDELAGAVLDELRLDPAAYEDCRQRAVLRELVLHGAPGPAPAIARDDLVAAMNRHRTGLGLARRAELSGWLSANGLDEAEYEILLADQCRMTHASDLPPVRLERALIAELKWSGRFSALRRRAEAKAAALAAAARPHGSSGTALPVQLRLAAWYFEQRLGRPIPDDIGDYARSLGLAGKAELYDLLQPEYFYVTLQVDTAG